MIRGPTLHRPHHLPHAVSASTCSCKAAARRELPSTRPSIVLSMITGLLRGCGIRRHLWAARRTTQSLHQSMPAARSASLTGTQPTPLASSRLASRSVGGLQVLSCASDGRLAAVSRALHWKLSEHHTCRATPGKCVFDSSAPRHRAPTCFGTTRSPFGRGFLQAALSCGLRQPLAQASKVEWKATSRHSRCHRRNSRYQRRHHRCHRRHCPSNFLRADSTGLPPRHLRPWLSGLLLSHNLTDYLTLRLWQSSHPVRLPVDLPSASLSASQTASLLVHQPC